MRIRIFRRPVGAADLVEVMTVPEVVLLPHVSEDTSFHELVSNGNGIFSHLQIFENTQ
jgi:hypothetical protein